MKPPASIALLAVYPPPFGGVANHVQRLSALLDQRGVSHVIYNAVSSSSDGDHVTVVSQDRTKWLLRFAFSAQERVIYIFSDRLSVWLIGAWMAMRGKRVVIRLRNQTLFDLLAKPHTGKLASFALRRVTHVVAVNRALAEAARNAGVPDSNVLHMPGFLPPLAQRSEADGLTQEQREFLDAHHPIIAANGKVTFHRGVDLYGLDHLVELLAHLVPTYPRLGLIVSFWDHQAAGERYLQELRDRARAHGVATNLLFCTESRPFVPVLERADIFVRPTSTDGDANSVREALYLGVPTVASDIVERPPGTVLVPTRNLSELCRAVRELLQTPQQREPNPDVIDWAQVDRYLKLLGELAR